MTSVVTDVLNSAGVLAKEDIPSKVESLKRKVEDIKIEIHEILKNRYIDFIPQYVKLDKLTNSLTTAKKEYEVLNYHIEKEIKPQMSNSVAEFHEMLDDLKKINTLNQAVAGLRDMHDFLETGNRCVIEKLYLDAAKNLLQFDKKFKEANCDYQKNIEIYRALKRESFVTKEKLIYQLQEAWKHRVNISHIDKTVKYKNQIILSIEPEPVNDFLVILNALNQVGYLESVLKTFGKQFLNSVCESLISEQSDVDVKSCIEGSKTIVTISILKSEPSSPKVALQYLTDIFKVLHDECFKWTLGDDAMSDTVMREFGNAIGTEFCMLLVEKCIKPAVPCHSKELDSFHDIIDTAVNLQNLLLELGFFNTHDNPLLQFIHNVDDLPANKMSQELLSRARQLMKQDLYQTVVSGTKEAPCNDSVIPDQTGNLNYMARTNSGLSKASFAFPSCHISVFAEQLVKLLHEVMQESKNLEAQSATFSLRMFFTARSICELYCCVVPVYHKDAISSIPQQTAIHHNNCMYIAHNLLTLGAQYNITKLLPVTFVDLVPEMRRIGTEAFLAQMRNQRQHILQILQGPEVFQNITQDDNLLEKVEKPVRQCLAQLQLLKRVWSDVLPLEVYFKAIGTLLNTFMEEIILHVISMEDIAAQTAAQFDSIFGIILEQSPDLFKASRGDKSETVHKCVRRWFKFQELQLVLGASLREIVDRWSSGKGPLADHFTAEEVKHLIRALFQNTERRAAALGKIR